MAFEAYQTAQAKQFGRAAPDPLGLDRLFGLHETQPAAAPAAGQTPTEPPSHIPPEPHAHEPVGAIVLIALGVLFLLGNFGLLRVGHLWPLILIGLGLWIAYKRTTERA